MEKCTKQFVALWLLCMLLPMAMITTMVGNEYFPNDPKRAGVIEWSDAGQAYGILIVATIFITFLVDVSIKQKKVEEKKTKKKRR